MNIYIAARFSKRHIANELANYLKSKGHTITSRWVLPDCDHVIATSISEQAADDERQRFAREDIEDLDAADWCISLMEHKARNNSRGGRHVEYGYALARGIKMTVIGCRETVFHHLCNVEHFN